MGTALQVFHNLDTLRQEVCEVDYVNCIAFMLIAPFSFLHRQLCFVGAFLTFTVCAAGDESGGSQEKNHVRGTG